MFYRILHRLILLLLLVSMAELSTVAASRSRKGREIYRALCAKCHGKNGEGVKGKYEDALHGDWSVEKLARVIDKTMPEDAPEKCNAAESAAVARYIYDAFYSREARARNHPARVELVRLTNRQYQNSVADLLKRFAEKDPPLTESRGLQGNYYKSRNFRDGDKVVERIDPLIEFDFGTNSPESEKIPKPEEFSIQWRGSLLAEETGEYEFILKTPNGARLWVNDDDETLIDAWVASGDLREHKASIHLLGGRRYPIRLDFFKQKDKATSVSLQWKPPHGVVEVIPTRNLSPVRTSPTFVVHTPFPPDDSSVGYERGVSVSKAWDEATTHAAIEVANYLARNLDALTRSKSSDTNRAVKVELFCTDLVSAAFRRPLTSEQKKSFISTHLGGGVSLEEGVKRITLLALKSPRFLYLGLEGGKAEDFEIASRLSYGLWDSLPDSELMETAAKRGLKRPENVSEQARQMLMNPRARAKMRDFLHHWLQMNHTEDFSKDKTLYPGFTPEIVADLRTSLNLFLDEVIWNGSSDYRQLLLADHLFLNDRLAKFYGVETNLTDSFVKVALPPGQRAGVLTHPYLLAAFSYQKSTSPIHRGVFLTRNIVGRALKPPPMAVSFKDSDFDPKLTMREKIAKLTESQACQTCHSVINPLGFSLENFDAVGRFRTREGDQLINSISDYVTDDGKSVRLEGARDVAEFALESEAAQAGFVEQLFHHLVKQPLQAYGPQVADRLRVSFVASDFNVQKIMVEMVTIAATHQPEKKLATR